jgi:hypothetical protein
MNLLLSFSRRHANELECGELQRGRVDTLLSQHVAAQLLAAREESHPDCIDEGADEGQVRVVLIKAASLDLPLAQLAAADECVPGCCCGSAAATGGTMRPTMGRPDGLLVKRKRRRWRCERGGAASGGLTWIGGGATLV